jgi:6-phosphogluconolactonase
MVMHIHETPEQVLIELAEYFVEISERSISERDEFNVALSGGNSPKKLYELLASSAYKNRIEWSKVYFFFGDERYVPFDSADNNGLMAKQALFDHLKIAPTQIFYFDTSKDPQTAAKNYAMAIAEHFHEKVVRFDLILLGLGDNSHTASLFPYSELLKETRSTIASVFVKELNAYRLTMTAPMINDAHHIAFLVYGASKAEAVKNVLQKERNIEEYPAQLIQPKSGDVHWFMDRSAAALLGG